MTDYNLGFLFSEDCSNVALVSKKRPFFQVGKLNGIGGHVEIDDLSLEHSMSREFEEETGVFISPVFWDYYGEFHTTKYRVNCFRAFSDIVFNCKTQTDEEILIVPIVANFYTLDTLMYNLPALINMALTPSITFFSISER